MVASQVQLTSGNQFSRNRVNVSIGGHADNFAPLVELATNHFEGFEAPTEYERLHSHHAGHNSQCERVSG